MKISLSCSLCASSKEIELRGVVDDWERADVCVEDALCPKHAIVERFLESQCPGCVSRFPECGLAKSFMFDGYPPIDESQKRAIEADGICPFRVNGTLQYSPRTRRIGELDLSERAPLEAAAALVRAIEKYIAVFGEK